jgi:hypothetical protein
VARETSKPLTPGWYSDQSGSGERWWNGSDWSGDVRASGAAPSEVVPAVAAGAPPRRTGSSTITRLGMQALAEGLVAVVLPLVPDRAISLGVISAIAAVLAIGFGAVDLQLQQRGRPGNRIVSMLAVALGIAGAIILTLTLLNTAHQSGPAAQPDEPSPQFSTLAPVSSETATAERMAIEPQLAAIEAALNRDVSTGGVYPALVHSDATSGDLMDAAGNLVGVVPAGEEFSYNPSADRRSYVVTLDESADGIGLKFDGSTGQTSDYID